MRDAAVASVHSLASITKRSDGCFLLASLPAFLPASVPTTRECQKIGPLTHRPDSQKVRENMCEPNAMISVDKLPSGKRLNNNYYYLYLSSATLPIILKFAFNNNTRSDYSN